jgi:hypothetical protein
MNLFRLAQTAGLLSLGAVGFTGCLSAPSYSNTPEISFERIDRTRYNTTTGGIVDSVFITINFQDGDGDLGLSNTEATSAPFGSSSTPYRNHLVTPFIKNPSTGRYDSARTVYPYLPKVSYYSTFDHVSNTTDNRASPLRGTLTRRFGFALGSPFLNPNYTPTATTQEVKFTISIFDRAKHRSNEVETTSIIITR